MLKIGKGNGSAKKVADRNRNLLLQFANSPTLSIDLSTIIILLPSFSDCSHCKLLTGFFFPISATLG